MKKDSPQTTGLKVTGKNNTFVDIKVNGFEQGINLGKSAEGNNFVNANVVAPPKVKRQRKWFEKPFGIIVLSVVGGLVLWALQIFFG